MVAVATLECDGDPSIHRRKKQNYLDVSTGLKGNHFRRFSGIQFGQRAPGRQHFTLPPRQARLLVDVFFSDATRSDSGQAATLRRTQQERQC
jgi:hypothetical protein